jgi:aerobic-type carbon monoxide dehydrogenase small subunit (CoxS/CutS family)
MKFEDKMKLLNYALSDAEEIMKDGRNWATVKSMHGRVLLNYGTIHTNGERERAIATISYEMRGDNIVTIKQVHT